MKRLPQCSDVYRRFLSPAVALVVLMLFVFPAARAQLPWSAAVAARGISGQFIVTASPRVSSLSRDRSVTTNAALVRLDPALLAVSAERIKKSLWQQLGVDDANRWRGEIFLALHPAQNVDENITIVSSRFNNVWNYRVELPDIVDRQRLVRAITAASLLELANRSAGDHSAELPSWLVDGLAAEVLAANSSAFVLSSPTDSQNGISEKRITSAQRGWDLMAEAHRVLQSEDALTFEQICWPTESQLAGRDGGVYHASAQLFVNELLSLKNGAKELRTMIQTLPTFYNWQVAFRAAFQGDFPQPVDLEKWWSLRTVDFAAFDIGSTWTVAASRERMDAILSVPVEYRAASNNMPSHAEISLQTVIRNFDPQRQMSILQNKLRDVQLAELRMAPQFAQLADGYRLALADYLGEGPVPTRVILGKNSAPRSSRASAKATLKKLDGLDARRRTIESALERSGSEMPALTGGNSNL
jgi:hypothetical protein